MNNFSDTQDQVPASLLYHLWNRNSLELIINLITFTLFFLKIMKNGLDLVVN